MMKVDDDVCDYYISLEKVLFAFMEWWSKQTVEHVLEESNRLLEAKDQQIQKLKYPNPESVYHIYNKRTNELLYVGKDCSKDQNRLQKHVTARNGIIMQNIQLIDLVLATMDDEDIDTRSFPCKPGEADQTETDHIQMYKPIYNIAKTDRRFRCSLCKCKPDGYKTRKAFIKHNNKCHPQAM